MNETEKAKAELQRCLGLLDMNDYYNGGQTVHPRFPAGSEERARIVAEASFWQARLDALTTACVEGGGGL